VEYDIRLADPFLLGKSPNPSLTHTVVDSVTNNHIYYYADRASACRYARRRNRKCGQSRYVVLLPTGDRVTP